MEETHTASYILEKMGEIADAYGVAAEKRGSGCS